jgi:hypothetical protein
MEDNTIISISSDKSKCTICNIVKSTITIDNSRGVYKPVDLCRECCCSFLDSIKDFKYDDKRDYPHASEHD